MNTRPTLPVVFSQPLLGFVAAIGLTLALPACGGGTVMSGVAVGKVGRGLSSHSHAVPQGAAICALQEAIAAQTGTAEKPLAETCAKAWKSDRLWHRSMIALGAYAAKLEAISTGTKPENAGQIEAALTGVRDASWLEGDVDAAARDAVTQLVGQVAANTSKGDLDKAIKDAAPHVKTLCDGLGPYLDAQVRALVDIQKEVEKKRTTRADRRCATLDSRTICVSESVVDRMTYANTFSQFTGIESSHLEARDAVSTFCAAHRKAEEAAANGQFSKDQTYLDIVEAVKSANVAQSPGAASPAVKGASPDKK
jgi:hypothetical protein